MSPLGQIRACLCGIVFFFLQPHVLKGDITALAPASTCAFSDSTVPCGAKSAVNVDASDEAALGMLQVGAHQAFHSNLARENGSSSNAASSGVKPIAGDISLDHFSNVNDVGCYDRERRTQHAVVDGHLHIRPFGGKPVFFPTLVSWMQRAGVLFANAYGIGQRFPVNSTCKYYLDCPGVPVEASMKNDFDNAQSMLDYASILTTSAGPHITLSMTFPDLARPETVGPRMKLLHHEYPHMFGWIGELNVVKQALFNNSAGYPVSLDNIAHWSPFMKVARDYNFPVGLHSDLGNDAEPLKYLPLIDKVLELYPKNKLVWLHLGGMSKQLNPLPPALISKPIFASEHADVVRTRLAKYANLMVDLAWDVLYEELYSDPQKRPIYAQLLNEFPTRFITGTDFVASDTKTEEDYKDQLAKTSDIFKDLSNEAFRNIALGQNYFVLKNLDFTAPIICE